MEAYVCFFGRKRRGGEHNRTAKTWHDDEKREGNTWKRECAVSYVCTETKQKGRKITGEERKKQHSLSVFCVSSEFFSAEDFWRAELASYLSRKN